MECLRASPGRGDRHVRPADAALLRLTLVGAALAVFAVGCGGSGNTRAAIRLLDGSSPSDRPAALGDVTPSAIPTRARAVRASELGSRGQACLASFRPEFSLPPATTVVERTGTIGASLTFQDRLGRFVLGCDRTAAPIAEGRRWCARSVGRLGDGRLRDPRVDISCRGTARARIGFGWVEPSPATRWILVRNGDRMEIYGVVAGLPVRIATTDVDVATSSATFDVTEYGASGKEVRHRRLHAGVAG
jgi:hypothetical protein